MPTNGTSTQRGYGVQHQAERRRWEPAVATGHVTCARCTKPIAPDQPWDLGHNADRTAWTGPECQPCNRSAGGTNGAIAGHLKRAMTVRDW